MSRRFITKYSCDYFRMKMKNHISVIIMLTISMLLCCVTVFFYGRLKYTEKASEKLLKNGNDGTGIIVLDASSAGDAYPDMYEIGMLEGVKSIGCYGWRIIENEGSKQYSDLYNRQLQIGDTDTKSSFSGLRILYSTQTLTDLCNLKIKEGASPTEYEPNTMYAFVGSNYKDVAVGESFTYSRYYGRYTGKLIICGTLEKGNEWLIDSFMGENIGASTISLDNEIIAFGAEVFDVSPLVFTCDETDMTEVCGKITDYCEQQGCRAYAISFSDWFASSKIAQSAFMKYLSQLLVLVLAVTVFIMVCTQAVVTLDSRRDFGIWYANGVGKKDILAVVGLNVIAESIVSGIFAFGLSWLFIMRMSEGNAAMASSVRVFLQFVLPTGILILAVISILGIAVPYNIINKDTPSKLIKEYTA